MGVGANYSQTDVTEMAKILAGLTVNADLQMEFQQRRAEPGPRELLGKTYATPGMDNIHAALRDLALQPATGQHLARKLVVHFVSDTPDADLVTAIAAAYNGSGGDLMATYAALLNHPAAWVDVTEKARQPFDFMVAALRALGVAGSQLRQMPFKQFRNQILVPMAGMGQPFKRPGGPNGFEEAAEEWITPQGLARRITRAMRVPPRLVEPCPIPSPWRNPVLPTAPARRCSGGRARRGYHPRRRSGVGLRRIQPQMRAAMATSIDRRNFLRGLGGVLGCSVAAHPMLTTVTMAGANGAARWAIIGWW